MGPPPACPDRPANDACAWGNWPEGELPSANSLTSKPDRQCGAPTPWRRRVHPIQPRPHHRNRALRHPVPGVRSPIHPQRHARHNAALPQPVPGLSGRQSALGWGCGCPPPPHWWMGQQIRAALQVATATVDRLISSNTRIGCTGQRDDACGFGLGQPCTGQVALGQTSWLEGPGQCCA